MMNGEAVRPGQPMQPGQPQQQLSPKDIEAQAAQLVNANREATEKVRALIQYALDTGELTPDELNMMIQLAKVAASNPASYPQVRQFAIQNGLGTEAEIPAQYDQGLILLIIAVGKTLQSGQGNMLAGQPPPQGQAPQTQGGLPSYSRGGMTGDQAHVAVVHDNEYVIPKEALLYHGKKTFDKLVEQARGGEV